MAGVIAFDDDSSSDSGDDSAGDSEGDNAKGKTMKASIRAALLSGLVFPGLGQFTLRRPKRALAFLLPAAVAVFYLAGQIIRQVDSIVEQIQDGAMALDVQRISDQLAAAPPGASDTLMTLASAVCVICWAGSIVDALIDKR